MKTTLEIPDAVFRRAKAKAAERGIPLRQFVTEAVEEKLREKRSPTDDALFRLAGQLKHLKNETRRINRLIEEEFEQIDAEEWV